VGNYAPFGTLARIHALTCIIIGYHSNWEVDGPSNTIVCKMCVRRAACGSFPLGPARPPPQLGVEPPTFGMRPGHGLGHPRLDSWATRVPAQPPLHRGFGRIRASLALKPVDSDSAERVNKNTHTEPRMTPAPAKEPTSAQMGAETPKGPEGGRREGLNGGWGELRRTME